MIHINWNTKNWDETRYKLMGLFKTVAYGNFMDVAEKVEVVREKLYKNFSIYEERHHPCYDAHFVITR